MSAPVPPPPADRVFPIQPRPADDPRFTFGLTLDVAQVLAKHGYDDVSKPAHARDFVELQQSLFGFLYGTGDES